MLMRTGISRLPLHLLVWLAALIVLPAQRATAQQQFDLPQQSSQAPSPGLYRANPSAAPLPQSGSPVQTLPQVSPQAPPPSAYQTPSEPPVSAPPSASENPNQQVLPAVFRGCWLGEVNYVDSLQRLPGGAKVGLWTPKTYRLCYRRIGDGPFVLTLTEAGIEQNARISNAEGRMTLVSTDGHSYASMRSDLDFDEYRAHANYFGRNTFAVHEVADLNCGIRPDGMHVEGTVTGWRDAVPWFRASWHTVFVHVGKPPQQVAAPSGGIPE
jgi:hypothetical protein